VEGMGQLGQFEI